MKKCPKCNRNIPSDANICPYCGTPQPGYQPMKRTPQNKKPMLFYYLLSLVLILAPMFLTYLFAFDTVDSNGNLSSKETITLSAYTKSQKEEVRYQYQSLSDFSKKVTNSEPYVKKIKAIENQLEKVLTHEQFDKSYLFQITQNNNIYALISYEIISKDSISYSIEYSYNLSGESECRIVSSTKNLKDIDVVNEQLMMKKDEFNQIAQVFNGKDNEKLLKQTNDDFIAMKENLKDSQISHYGKGVSNSQSSHSYAIRVFSSNDSYRLKTTFETSLKKKNFMGNLK